MKNNMENILIFVRNNKANIYIVYQMFVDVANDS